VPVSTGTTTAWTAWWQRTRADHPALTRVLKPVVDVWSELTRVELVDRSLALGAQALLALIPLLMVLGVASSRLGAAGLSQVQDVMGVPEEELSAIALTGSGTTTASTVSVLVAIVSATSFSRALQRMYARVWDLPKYQGVRAIRGSVVWLIGWILMLQATAGLIRFTADIPLTGPTIQLVCTSLVWWWTAHLLLGGRVTWRQLLAGGVVTGSLLVLLNQLSLVFMPAFARANLEQFGPLGIVFAVASWLVVFGGVLIVSTVLGRFVSALLTPLGEEQPTWLGRPSRPRA
jgi:membrane protein